MRSDGFVKLVDVLSVRQLFGRSVEQVRTAVAADSKQRMSLLEDDDGHIWIRFVCLHGMLMF